MLNRGSSDGWKYGAGTVNRSRQATLTSSSSGELPPANFSTLSLSSEGVKTATDNATSLGVMTPDKKTIFVTETQGSNVYGLRIIQLTGQTFSPSDMVGTWRSHGLASSSSSAIWMYDLSYINSAGDQTHVASINRMGNTTPSAEIQALTLGPTGTITESGNQDMHGQASFNKDVAIATKTRDGGFYALNIILKQ